MSRKREAVGQQSARFLGKNLFGGVPKSTNNPQILHYYAHWVLQCPPGTSLRSVHAKRDVIVI
jgi:hypothetical protein